MVKKSDNQQEQQVTEQATLCEKFSIAEAAAITGVASHHIQQWIDLLAGSSLRSNRPL